MVREEPARLSEPLTPLVGREQATAEVIELLRDPAVRLVTLTGPGGVGKTRLALRVATELQDDQRFVDGIAVVELAAVRTADLVVATVAQSLGLTRAEAAAVAVRAGLV